MEKVFDFLSELNLNNNKAWFDKNRGRYEESRKKMLFITEVLANEIRKFDPDIPVMDPKDCLFRIFRDVRFSNDKRPYKTNMGSFIARGGRKGIRAGYYVHIEPGSCFVGGGIYMPQPDVLKAIRLAIFESPDEFAGIINDEKFKAYYPVLYDDQLKTAPKGFPADFEYNWLIRYKSYAFSHFVKNNIVSGENFIEYTVQAFRELYRANRFLNDALEKNL